MNEHPVSLLGGSEPSRAAALPRFARDGVLAPYATKTSGRIAGLRLNRAL